MNNHDDETKEMLSRVGHVYRRVAKTGTVTVIYVSGCYIECGEYQCHRLLPKPGLPELMCDYFDGEGWEDITEEWTSEHGDPEVAAKKARKDRAEMYKARGENLARQRRISNGNRADGTKVDQ